MTNEELKPGKVGELRRDANAWKECAACGGSYRGSGAIFLGGLAANDPHLLRLGLSDVHRAPLCLACCDFSLSDESLRGVADRIRARRSRRRRLIVEKQSKTGPSAEWLAGARWLLEQFPRYDGMWWHRNSSELGTRGTNPAPRCWHPIVCGEVQTGTFAPETQNLDGACAEDRIRSPLRYQPTEGEGIRFTRAELLGLGPQCPRCKGPVDLLGYKCRVCGLTDRDAQASPPAPVPPLAAPPEPTAPPNPPSGFGRASFTTSARPSI